MRRLSPDARANGWGDPGRRAECQSCTWRGSFADTVLPIGGDLCARVAPSEPMPCGECPACGALAVELNRCPYCDRYVDGHSPAPGDCPLMVLEPTT